MDIEKFREISAWVVSVVFFFVAQMFFLDAVGSVGIETYIDYGEVICVDRGVGSSSWEECSDGSSTDIALFFRVFCLVLAVGLWHMIRFRTWVPFSGHGRHTQIHFFAWLIGSLTVSMISFFVLSIIGRPFGPWINAVIAIVTLYCGYRYVNKPR